MEIQGMVCGTGEWAGPLPGDPSDIASILASTVVGGILVTWTYPTINPHAVAHTQLYRSTTDNFGDATQIGLVSGNSYYDLLFSDTEVRYYYWIRFISINGTTGNVIGPASALTRPYANDLKSVLDQQISESFLDQFLRGKIDSIGELQSSLSEEIAERLANNTAWAQALNDLNTGLAEAITVISTENTERITAEQAFAQQLTVIGAGMHGNTAAILTEQTTRASEDAALAQLISATQTQLGNDIVTVEQTLQSNINTTNGRINGMYAVRIDVNGYIGGFGIANDGATIDAAFLVNKFWIGTPGQPNVNPFVVAGGVVYMNAAMIGDATITNAKIANLSVDSLKLTSGAVLTDKVATNAVTVQATATGNGYATFSISAPYGGTVLILFYVGGGLSNYSTLYLNGGVQLNAIGQEILAGYNWAGEGGVNVPIYTYGEFTRMHVVNVGAGTHTFVLSTANSAPCIMAGLLTQR